LAKYKWYLFLANLINSNSKQSPLTLVLILVFLAANAILAFWFASPYVAINSLKKAAEIGDSATLTKMLDLSAVRRSLSPLQDSAIIDMALSPAGIANLFSCSNLVSGTESMAGSASNLDPATGMQTIGVVPEVEPNTIDSNNYDNLDQFVSSHRQKYSGQGVSFVLKRAGLFSWQVKAIEFQSSPVVHTPVFFVGYLYDELPDGIKNVQLYDRLLAVNGEAVVDYPRAVQQFKAAGNSAEISVLRNGALKTFSVSKARGQKFGFVLSGFVGPPLPEVLAAPAALDPNSLIELVKQQNPAAAASLVQQGQLILLQPETQILRGPAKEIAIGGNNGVTVMQGRVLEGPVVAGAGGLPGRNYWMLVSNFPQALPPN